jgi:hypothetical protein
MEKGMESASSPSFKQALKIVLKRNIVRLVLLAILLMIWLGMLWFRDEERYSVSPRTMAKVSRVVFSLQDPNGKKTIETQLLAVDSMGMSESALQECSKKLHERLRGKAVWVRSAYLDSAQRTVGKVLLPASSDNSNSSSPDDIGLMLVRDGCAFYCRQQATHLSSADQALYHSAEESAKKSRLGAWKEVDQTPSSACQNPSNSSLRTVQELQPA